MARKPVPPKRMAKPKAVAPEEALNPIAEIRKKAQVTAAQFAVAIDVPVSVINNTEAGVYPDLTTSLREGLRLVGLDPDEVNKRYVEWVKTRKEVSLDDIRKRLAKK